MCRRLNRRDFLKACALAGTGFWVASRPGFARSNSPHEKLNLALIGAGGQGGTNLQRLETENIVALCDVDDARAGRSLERYPQARRYRDFRRLLDEMERQIDAVVISTPDHMHALPAIMAMRMGKHVYCEKPLAWCIEECRLMAEAAVKYKVATQMGNTGHSGLRSNIAVEVLRRGDIGEVREVHSWSDRPGNIWRQGMERPDDPQPVPSTLDWDLWLGVAGERPYHEAYAPVRWRGWFDFGSGAMGDMACHIVDVAFRALELTNPSRISARQEGLTREAFPNWSVIMWEFPATNQRGPVTLTWHDGGRKPPAELVDGQDLPANGSLFLGSKGRLLLPHGRAYKLFPEAEFEGHEPPEVQLVELPEGSRHHQEWIAACKSGTPTGTHFGYSAAMTEMLLLGNLALRAGEPVEWDAANRRTNAPAEINNLLAREYRKGWELPQGA